MGWAGVALQLVGGVMGAAGQAQSGRDARKAEEYNAGVLRANAEAVKTANKFDIDRMEKSKRKFLGTQRALYAKSGVRQEGSPLEVMIDSAAEMELDKFISRYNARIESQQLENQAEYRIKMGKSAERAAKTQAVGTLLSTASKYYGSK